MGELFSKFGESNKKLISGYLVGFIAAIISHWIRNTPLVAVISDIVLLGSIVGLIFIFFRGRKAKTILCIMALTGTGLFFWAVWPQTHATRAPSHPISVKQPPRLPAQMHPEPAQKSASAKQVVPVKKEKKMLASHPQTKGNNNTIYTPMSTPPSINGSGNTIVGATDSNGNTILGGGTTIGAGARGCPTCVVIGAGANGGEAQTKTPDAKNKGNAQPKPQ